MSFHKAESSNTKIIESVQLDVKGDRPSMMHSIDHSGLLTQNVNTKVAQYSNINNSSAQILTIKSSSNNDTVLGTGIRKVKISGVNSSGNYQEEEINMNGIAGQSTVNSYKRVNALLSTECGTNLESQGTLSIVDSSANTWVSTAHNGSGTTNSLKSAVIQSYFCPNDRKARIKFCQTYMTNNTYQCNGSLLIENYGKGYYKVIRSWVNKSEISIYPDMWLEGGEECVLVIWQNSANPAYARGNFIIEEFEL